DYAGDVVRWFLDEELTAGLKALSRRHGTTLFMTLLGSWAVLLGRLSGQPEVVIGTPVANRGRREIEKLIGFFVNTLALRVDVSGSPRVGELLDRMKVQVIAAQQHQDIPFEQVVDIVKPARSLAHSPLFQTMLNWQNPVEGKIELEDVEIRPLKSAPRVTAKFDLTLSLREAGEIIVGSVEYATSLLDRATVERYLGYFRTLLEGMVAVSGESQAVDLLPLLSQEERNQLLHEWNDTRTEYPLDQCIHELFERQAERTPEAVAVVYEETALSYGDL